MELILPDTNILILALADQEQYGKIFKTWIVNRQLIFSPIVIAEFLIGANSKETKLINQLLSQFPVSPINLQTAQIAAKLRKTHLSKKKKLILPDCLIAAQCQIHHFTLATLNPKDFPTNINLYLFK